MKNTGIIDNRSKKMEYKRGKRLANGKGLFNMLDVCKKYGYSDKNIILSVSRPEDLNSNWYVYEKIQKD